MSIVDTIKGCPLFLDLYDKEIDHLLSGGQILSFYKDEKVIREGEEGSELFILLSGKLQVQKAGKTLVELKRGALFGEMVLLNERTRTADIVASNDCELLQLNYDTIFGLFDKRPKILSVILLNLGRILSERLKENGQVINELNSKLIEAAKKAS